jgi:hypothetical protein
MIPASRLTRLAMTVVALTTSCLFLQGQAVQPGLFTIGDPSPDLKFGVPAAGQMGSAGRIVSLIMAPDGQTLGRMEVNGWSTYVDAREQRSVKRKDREPRFACG